MPTPEGRATSPEGRIGLITVLENIARARGRLEDGHSQTAVRLPRVSRLAFCFTTVFGPSKDGEVWKATVNCTNVSNQKAVTCATTLLDLSSYRLPHPQLAPKGYPHWRGRIWGGSRLYPTSYTHCVHCVVPRHEGGCGPAWQYSQPSTVVVSHRPHVCAISRP